MQEQGTFLGGREPCAWLQHKVAPWIIWCCKNLIACSFLITVSSVSSFSKPNHVSMLVKSETVPNYQTAPAAGVSCKHTTVCFCRGKKHENHLTRLDFLLVVAEIMLKDVICVKGKFKNKPQNTDKAFSSVCLFSTLSRISCKQFMNSSVSKGGKWSRFYKQKLWCINECCRILYSNSWHKIILEKIFAISSPAMSH